MNIDNLEEAYNALSRGTANFFRIKNSMGGEMIAKKLAEGSAKNEALGKAMHLLGVVQYNLKKFSEASHSFKISLANRAAETVKVRLYYQRGCALAHLKKYERAYESLKKALKHRCSVESRDYILILHERAKCLQMLTRHHEAIDDFNKVIALFPTDDRAIFRRGWSYKATKCFDLAAEDFEDAKLLAPDCPYYQLKYRGIRDIEVVVLVLPGNERRSREEAAIKDGNEHNAFTRE
jgi:tetratricopeptide (TPR) repeat protein